MPLDSFLIAPSSYASTQLIDANDPFLPNSPGLLTGVTGYVAVDHTLALTIVAFRGSHSFRNWAADLDAALIPTDICPGCWCHQGL